MKTATVKNSTIDVKITHHITVTIPNAPDVVHHVADDPDFGEPVLIVRRGHVRLVVSVESVGYTVHAGVFSSAIAGCSKSGITVVNNAGSTHELQAFIDSSLCEERQIAERNARALLAESLLRDREGME